MEGANQVSSAMEDYLEQILHLINQKGYARVVDIASRLKISQASVTNMIQRLDTEGLVKYEKYRGMVLTEQGARLAENIVYRHRILSEFLELFDLNKDTIYQDVEGMEHHTSPSTLKVIEELTIQIRKHPEIIKAVKQAGFRD